MMGFIKKNGIGFLVGFAAGAVTENLVGIVSRIRGKSVNPALGTGTVG
jgi:hypothetical protein